MAAWMSVRMWVQGADGVSRLILGTLVDPAPPAANA